MNNNDFLRSRRFRYGSMSVVITILIIAATILINACFSALASKFLWYIDLTTEGIYTLSDGAKELLDDTFESVTARREEEGITEPLQVTIKFCDLEDNIMEDTAHRYALMTARELADRYPDYVSVEYINIWENPTAVEKYKSSVLTTIYSSDVIVESGTEFRHYNLTDFYLTNDDATTPWAYYGEKRLGSAILAVTQAESPVAAVLTGHGERFTDTELVSLLEMAGYEIKFVDDLINTTLPDNCRLMVCYNPTADFLAADSVSDLSEIRVLDEFLAGESHSLMVYMSPSSPVLPNLEDYLSHWGISFGRYTNALGNTYPMSVKEDASMALTSDGMTFIGEYDLYGLGASLTEDMRNVQTPRRVVFKNAMPIYVSEQFETYDQLLSSGDTYSYGSKSLGNGISRTVYNVFHASETAVMMSDGQKVAQNDAQNPAGLLTISCQERFTQEDDLAWEYADQSSYVVACGSTEFVSQALLQSATYGNSEVLLHTLLETGKEAVPTELSLMPFSDTTIDSLTVGQANAYTLTLTIIPTAIVFGLGIFVIVRRKYA